MSFSPDANALLQHLQRQGPLTSSALQTLLGQSQPTVSRWLRALGTQVVTLGTGRSTRYALPESILGLSARQPLHWIDEAGTPQPWGELTLLSGHRVHVAAPGLDVLTPADELPWFLAPLRAQGFLGRLLGQQLAGLGFDSNPERWRLDQVLYAATRLPDAPGAVVLGDALTLASSRPDPIPTADPIARAAAYDARADDVVATLPAGSSAGGEQAKFLCHRDDGGAELVKFSPPLGTPFGERWSDLLHAEAAALQLLGELGPLPVAHTELVTTTRRTCLVSRRFDRLPGGGRRHAVALDAIHQAFVPGPRQHWAATLTELARQRRVPAELPAQVLDLLHFGRLIGNTDMHFGNLSLLVSREDVARGRFTVAPLYDMLPMRWRPDVVRGDWDLSPFEPDAAALASPARAWAVEFWRRMAEHPGASRRWRILSGSMGQRLAP